MVRVAKAADRSACLASTSGEQHNSVNLYHAGLYCTALQCILLGFYGTVWLCDKFEDVGSRTTHRLQKRIDVRLHLHW